MKYLTFDLEVENYKSNKRLAAPFDSRNYIVAIGWQVNMDAPEHKYYDKWHRDPVMPAVIDEMVAGDMIIGFNTKFDMLWVWDDPRVQAAIKRGVVIYCGQYAEYLMGGAVQEVQMVSMNDTAEQYGGGCKLDAVKEMWEAGYLTSEIPKDLLIEYLVGSKEVVGDVRNTWLMFVGQTKRMRAEHPEEFRTMFKMRMDGLLATIEIEYNGVFVDAEIGEELRNDCVAELAEAGKVLDEYIPELPPELIFNWGSPLMKSCLIFGGTIKYEKWEAHKDDNGNMYYAQKDEKWPLFQDRPISTGECIKAGALYVYPLPHHVDGAFKHNEKYYLAQDTYKSGKKAGEGKFKNVKVDNLEKPKGKKQPQYFTMKGYTKPNPSWQGDSTDAYDNPLYSVGAKIIEKLEERGLPFTTALSTHTKLEKTLGTYYWKEDKKGNRSGMLTLLGEDGIVHHKLNHTSTVTTRMSSSDPNLQNIPRGTTSPVKRAFVSRFGKIGKMAEIDYSQLEVVIQGVLSRDPNLMKDLNNKVDFHCKRLAKVLGEEYDHVWNMCHVVEDKEYKAMRTNAKIFSFQRAYGAGAATIAASTGMDINEVKKLIEAEEAMYPGVVAFDDGIEKSIQRNKINSGNKVFINGVAFTQHEAHWDAPTGTRYMWRENEAPQFMQDKGKYVGFSPTERKNYPVQGFGGEVVQAMLGKVFRYMIENDRFDGNVLLVNTVHDCIWLDGHADKINDVALEAQRILEMVPEVFNAAFPDLHIEVPFPCETEVGNDMFKMETIHREAV